MRQPEKFILPDSQQRANMRSRFGLISQALRRPIVATRRQELTVVNGSNEVG